MSRGVLKTKNTPRVYVYGYFLKALKVRRGLRVRGGERIAPKRPCTDARTQSNAGASETSARCVSVSESECMCEREECEKCECVCGYESDSGKEREECKKCECACECERECECEHECALERERK